MLLFSRPPRRRPPPLCSAMVFAVTGCGSLQVSCDSERARDVASRPSPAVSARALQPASAQLPSVTPPATTPSPSTDVPKPEYTIEEPRCAPNEADCLPQPYNGSEELIVGTVTGAPYRYKASGKRYPQREVGEGAGACKHDGDCIARSMCLECISRFRVPPVRPCRALYLGEFDGSFCGCIENRCRWFTQRLTQRVVTSTKNLQVRLGGAPTSDPKLLSEAAHLFDLDLSNCYDPRRHLLPARHTFTMTVGKYGEAETNVGSHPGVRKCVSDAFNDMTLGPSWISDDFLKHGEIQFTGVLEVKMAWVP